MANQKIAGTIYFKIDGTQYAARGGFKVQPLSSKRSGIIGQDGPHGFKQEALMPHIEGELSDLGSLSLMELGAIEGATITLELTNGKVYVLADASHVGESPIETSDGKVPVRFEGMDCAEMMP
jgi:Phage tail tube protein